MFKYLLRLFKILGVLVLLQYFKATGSDLQSIIGNLTWASFLIIFSVTQSILYLNEFPILKIRFFYSL